MKHSFIIYWLKANILLIGWSLGIFSDMDAESSISQKYPPSFWVPIIGITIVFLLAIVGILYQTDSLFFAPFRHFAALAFLIYTAVVGGFLVIWFVRLFLLPKNND